MTYLEVGCAVLVLSGSETPDFEGLRAYCRQQLADYKCPKHFGVVDELPHNASGTILKHVLRETYRTVGELVEEVIA